MLFTASTTVRTSSTVRIRIISTAPVCSVRRWQEETHHSNWTKSVFRTPACTPAPSAQTLAASRRASEWKLQVTWTVVIRKSCESISKSHNMTESVLGFNVYVLLWFSAFYSEPRLRFSLLTDGVNLLVTSDGGYPSPTLQWLMENSDITNQTQTHLMQDTQTGLYVVSSWINLTEVSNSSLTFILRNKPLGQDIRRDIQLYSGKDFQKHKTF